MSSGLKGSSLPSGSGLAGLGGGGLAGAGLGGAGGGVGGGIGSATGGLGSVAGNSPFGPAGTPGLPGGGSAGAPVTPSNSGLAGVGRGGAGGGGAQSSSRKGTSLLRAGRSAEAEGKDDDSETGWLYEDEDPWGGDGNASVGSRPVNPKLRATRERSSPTRMPRIHRGQSCWRLVAQFVTVLTTVALAGGPSPALATDVQSGQWYLSALNIPKAQLITRGQGITVAVIDGGVDPSVAALQGQVLQGTQFGVPQSPYGTVDTASNGHGTKMAGIIAGIGSDNGLELGVAPGVKILPIAANSDEEIAREPSAGPPTMVLG
ncbi:S8 family serine peptidase [Fodinicola feengrottensis]|uniref:S8 family serine peptidase n=1 Tax=Fodinicola feengrottensis TaxID=435914 RepID=UPI0028BDB418|nr:S8 family serine peptidase [Fodinicola feengrottensis]